MTVAMDGYFAACPESQHGNVGHVLARRQTGAKISLKEQKFFGSSSKKNCFVPYKQHFLYFLPLPHGQGALRLAAARRGGGATLRG